MCMSRLHRVVDVGPEGRVRAVDLDGNAHVLMTLAFDGPTIECGDWVVAHSGFALSPAEPDDVDAAVAEWSAVPGRGRTATDVPEHWRTT